MIPVELAKTVNQLFEPCLVTVHGPGTDALSQRKKATGRCSYLSNIAKCTVNLPIGDHLVKIQRPSKAPAGVNLMRGTQPVNVRYVDQLDASEILQAQTDSHGFWGRNMALPDRIARLERHLTQAGPNRFRMCGLVDMTGTVVSSAKLYELQLLNRGTVCPAVGIGAVFTPECRHGEGHASQLLQRIAEHSAQSGCKALLLFSDITPEFYERLGYFAFPAFNWKSDVKSLPSDTPFLTKQTSSADVGVLHELYASSWSREISRLHRDHFRWTLFRELNWAQPDLLLFDDQKIVGYLTAQKTETCYWVDEYVIAEGEDHRFWATVRILAEQTGASEVRGWQSLKPVPDHFQLQRRERAIPMLKFLDPTLGNQKLDPQFTHFGSLDHF